MSALLGDSYRQLSEIDILTFSLGLVTFATKQTDNDLPTVGYTTVYPTAMIAKIGLAQGLAAFLT